MRGEIGFMSGRCISVITRQIYDLIEYTETIKTIIAFGLSEGLRRC